MVCECLWISTRCFYLRRFVVEKWILTQAPQRQDPVVDMLCLNVVVVVMEVVVCAWSLKRSLLGWKYKSS